MSSGTSVPASALNFWPPVGIWANLMRVPDATTPRSPLELSELTAAAGPAWSIQLLDETPSTNAVAVSSASPGLVVVTDHQTAGRGRLDRVWTTPRGSALTFSTVVELDLPPARWPLLPLVAGLAVLSGLSAVPGATLKWPNDVLIDDRKVAGILVERVGNPALAVIGMGINVDMTADELPVPQATSLALAGGPLDRARAARHHPGRHLVRGRPAALVTRRRFSTATAPPAPPSAAMSRPPSPTAPPSAARATSIDDHGRLVVDGHPLAAADVIHARLES